MLHSTPLERLDPHGTLSDFKDRASSFLLRTVNDFVPVLVVGVLGDQFRFLEALEFSSGHSHVVRVDRGSVQANRSPDTGSMNVSAQVRCRRCVRSSLSAPSTNLGGDSCEVCGGRRLRQRPVATERGWSRRGNSPGRFLDGPGPCWEACRNATLKAPTLTPQAKGILVEAVSVVEVTASGVSVLPPMHKDCATGRSGLFLRKRPQG